GIDEIVASRVTLRDQDVDGATDGPRPLDGETNAGARIERAEGSLRSAMAVVHGGSALAMQEGRGNTRAVRLEHPGNGAGRAHGSVDGDGEVGRLPPLLDVDTDAACRDRAGDDVWLRGFGPMHELLQILLEPGALTGPLGDA